MVAPVFPGLAPWALLHGPFRAGLEVIPCVQSRPSLRRLHTLHSAPHRFPRACALGSPAWPFQGRYPGRPCPQGWAFLLDPFRVGAVGGSWGEWWRPFSQGLRPGLSCMALSGLVSRSFHVCNRDRHCAASIHFIPRHIVSPGLAPWALLHGPFRAGILVVHVPRAGLSCSTLSGSGP